MISGLGGAGFQGLDGGFDTECAVTVLQERLSASRISHSGGMADSSTRPSNQETKEPGVAEIIIAKQRNGPVGTTKLAFLRQWTKFENLAPDYQGPGEY